MVKNKRFFRRVVSVVVMLSVTATLFICCSAPVYARVANGSNFFKYVVATFRDVEGEVPLTSGQFDYSTNVNNDVHFNTYLPETANSVAFRMELTSVFNNLLTHWYSIKPSMSNTENTNIIFYRFYIVERSYEGTITDVAKGDYIYTCAMTLSTDPINNSGIFTVTDENYGGKYMGRYRDSSISPLPQFDSNCDLIVALYSPSLRTDFVINFNLIVGSGSGSRNDYADIENGTNTVPTVPDNWDDLLHKDDEFYEKVDLQISDILNYVSNPSTMLNKAMFEASKGLEWTETKVILQCVDNFLSIPLINIVAWALALFGSVFSLFNLSISFVPTGSGRSGGGKRD